MAEARLRAALGRPSGASSDFDLNPGAMGKPATPLRAAAVLVALWGDRIILTKRASHLKHHPGQIAFPGGKVDATDASPKAAALREAQEEIGLDPTQVEVLGTLATHETVTGFAITPVVGIVRGPFQPLAEAGEVDEVFGTPLAHLMDASRYSIQGRIWRGSLRRYYTVPWGPYYVWGATARILRGLADRYAD